MVGLSKATWIKRFLSLDDSDAIITSLIRLGEGNIIKNLVDGQLPSDLRPLEKFTCNAYSNTPSSPDNIPDLRLHLFRTKNYEGENLPPTRGSLLPHITRVNLICMRDKSYKLTCPDLPPPEDNGFKLVGDSYMPIMCLNLPAPKAVMELTKCQCKKGCGKRCSCFSNSIPCTPLCKCFYDLCDNIHIERDVDDSLEY